MAKQILIVEDEKIITKSLQKLLQSKGYVVTVANSGQEALKLVEGSSFDLLVCDIMMPEMDGIETIKGIRKSLEEQGKSAIPEIVITGYANEEKYQAAVDLKVSDYLYKPFDMSDFLEAIEKHVN